VFFPNLFFLIDLSFLIDYQAQVAFRFFIYLFIFLLFREPRAGVISNETNLSDILYAIFTRKGCLLSSFDPQIAYYINQNI